MVKTLTALALALCGAAAYADSPRSAVQAYLEACRAGDYRAAATHLDLGELPPAEREAAGPVLARHLKVVLDRKLWVDPKSLADEPAGNTDDDLPEGVDRIGTLHTRWGEVELLVERVTEGNWKIASSAVERIPALYAEFGYGFLGELLPEHFFVIRFLEIELWQWIGLALLLLVAFAASHLARSALHRAILPLVRKTATDLDDRLIEQTQQPMRWILALVLFSLGVLALGLAVPAQRFLGRLEAGLAVVLMSWLLMRVVDVIVDEMRERLMREGSKAVVSILPLGRKSAKAVLLVLATIVMLQHLGLNVTGLVAGLGVGGLAVALAAQKTLENLFGGVTLAADQPVRVGDLCRFGNRVGTVEDVGLRSTRIRTAERTIVTVANAEFSQMQLENLAVRDRINLQVILGLRYETTPDQLRRVLAELRQLLAGHPRVHPEQARVRFVAFGQYALDVEVFGYIATSDWNEFLAIREELFLSMIELIEACGTQLAFPSQTLYLGRDSGLGRERAQEAERSARE